MRDHVWKRGLRQVYQPPAPRKKQAFLEPLQEPELSTTRFLMAQAAYLRPWNWLLSVAVLILVLWMTQNQQPWDVWMVSALLPFVALSTVTEMNRSTRYHCASLYPHRLRCGAYRRPHLDGPGRPAHLRRRCQ